MPISLDESAVLTAISDAQGAARSPATTTVPVNGSSVTIRRPYPSPTDWRDCWMYFLMIDRFNNPATGPKRPWNLVCDERQGGTFEGVRTRLGYLADLGVKAIWLSPVLKNPAPPLWKWNYHGYATQDFLNVDGRFASDGTQATAEKELTDLVNEAHARGIYIILDIVLNHAARVFDYVIGGATVDSLPYQNSELPIEWLSGLGTPNPAWQDDVFEPPQPGPDDAIWPNDLQRAEFFRRRGCKYTDDPAATGCGYVPGDFGSMRQLVVEYDANVAGQESYRKKWGGRPVLNILIRAYAYLMAKYDIDGYRIDTVKYVHPLMVETFGNAMREYAMSMGKTNFFTFGEVYGDENQIADFIGRNSGAPGEGFGVDAALDFPLFYKLGPVSKGLAPVDELRAIFENRKKHEEQLLNSHGEAGRYFVSFLDNHDQKERIKHPLTPEKQVELALGLVFTLQGIPCVYYGTEQLLEGTVDASEQPDLSCLESVREALWGKRPTAFSNTANLYKEIKRLSDLRAKEPAIRYGRLYFREVSGDGTHFGHPYGNGGIVAFSRILGDREVLTVANTGQNVFTGRVLVDHDLNMKGATPKMNLEYSTTHVLGDVPVQEVNAQINGGPATLATVSVTLQPNELQVFGPMAAPAAVSLRRKAAGEGART